MPSSLPPSLREAWGEEVATDLVRFIEQTVREQGVHRDEFREVLSRLDVLEERFDQVDDRLDRMDERLNHMGERLDGMNAHIDERFDGMNARIDERFDAMNTRIDERFDRVDERFDQMYDQLDRMNDRILSMTRWLIGLLVLFGTMVTVLLGIAQFAA